MGRVWPALDVRRAGIDPDLLFAAADDFSPTAIEERDAALRVFFATAAARDQAGAALSARFSLTPVDVDDEDWARRGQPDLAPVVVGRLVVRSAPLTRSSDSTTPALPAPIELVVPPSMGFGTGHHATTRLCLAALQSLELAHKFVLDVGTGSGVLAIAAAKLGAARAVGTDDDADALQAARENLQANQVTNVELRLADVLRDALPVADVVVANLTGALIVRAAPRLVTCTAPGGVLILSGILAIEHDDVRRAFANQRIVDVVQVDEWLCLTFKST